MNITVLLADSAQAVEGKLYVLGGGWTDATLTPDRVTPPHALAVLAHVPWAEANQGHQLTVTLVDADGHAAVFPDGQSLQFVIDFEVGRPAGTQPGVALPVPFALNVGPLPLAPGRYKYELAIDGQPVASVDVSFTVLG